MLNPINAGWMFHLQSGWEFLCKKADEESLSGGKREEDRTKRMTEVERGRVEK